MKKLYTRTSSQKLVRNTIRIASTLLIMLFSLLVFGNQKSIYQEVVPDTLTMEEQSLLVSNNEIALDEDEKDKVETDSKSNTSKAILDNRGYLVTVNSSNDKFKHVVTTDQERVVKIFQAYFGTDLDIMKILNYSPYFDMKTDDIYFYAEKGTVKEGKDGKLKFKRLKKSRK